MEQFPQRESVPQAGVFHTPRFRYNGQGSTPFLTDSRALTGSWACHRIAEC